MNASIEGSITFKVIFFIFCRISVSKFRPPLMSHLFVAIKVLRDGFQVGTQFQGGI
jgi:hypothetical protein